MNSIKNIVLLGAGAVGVLPADKLLKLQNIRLTVAADRERVNRYRQNGIFFNGNRMPLSFISPEEVQQDMEAADLIIVATKSTTLAEALENVVPLTGKHTIFLPLLNGITAHEVIAERFPENTVLRGYFLGHASVRRHNRISHDGVGTFYCGGERSALDAVAGVFAAADINTGIPEDMDSAIWKKFILNVGINQVQAMFYADYGAVQSDPALLDYCRNLMREALAVAEAEKIAGTDGMIDAAMEVVMSMPPGVQTSMLQDMLARRPTEVGAFAGTICLKAEKYGIQTPLNRQVLDEITRREQEFAVPLPPAGR